MIYKNKKSKNEKPEVSLIIPAYNEERTIEKITIDSKNILKKPYKQFEIIIMDDCSTDNTLQICKDLTKKIKNLRIFSNNKNIGKTKNLIKGFNVAKSDVIAFIDADYQYDPLDLPNIINKVIVDGYDISSGNRHNRDDPWHRKVASKAFNLFNRIMFNIKIEDVNCGLKAMRKDVLKRIRIEYFNAKWFVDTEMLAKAYRKKIRIIQTPIRHMPRKEGNSKVNIFSLGIETIFYGIMLKIKFILKRA